MDGARFDRLVTGLRGIATRRAALAFLAGLIGVPATVPGADGKRKRRRKTCTKQCGVCKRCKRGKCQRHKRNGAPCGGCATCHRGRCHYACQAGEECSGGVCAREPSCGGADIFCVEDADCCSGACVDADGNGICSCACSPVGVRCRLTGDCCSGNCVGFVCAG